MTYWIAIDENSFATGCYKGTVAGAIESAEKVRLGSKYENGAFTPPDIVLPPNYTTADDASLALVVMIERVTQLVTGHVPLDEKLSWDQKEAAAIAYVDGAATAAQTAWIETEASIVGEEPADTANLIVTRASTYKTIIATLAGVRRKAQAAITTADPGTYPFAFDTILEGVEDELAAALSE